MHESVMTISIVRLWLAFISLLFVTGFAFPTETPPSSLSIIPRKDPKWHGSHNKLCKVVVDQRQKPDPSKDSYGIRVSFLGRNQWDKVNWIFAPSISV